MVKRLIRVGTVGAIALLALSSAPIAEAKYPPTIRDMNCIFGVRSVRATRFLRVKGVEGCALRQADQRLTRTKVKFAGVQRRNRIGGPLGDYSYRFRVRRWTREGRNRLRVRTGGAVYDRFPFIRNWRTRTNTSAVLPQPPPSMTLPTLAAVATLAGGGWFMFAPVGRRRRLFFRKAFGRRRR